MIPYSHTDLARAVCLVAMAALIALSLPAPAHTQVPTAEQRAVMLACRADARKLCSGVKPGGGGVAACLGEQMSSLAPSCQAQIGKLKGCQDEVRKLCPEAEGAAALKECAQNKRGELSTACRAAEGT